MTSIRATLKTMYAKQCCKNESVLTEAVSLNRGFTVCTHFNLIVTNLIRVHPCIYVHTDAVHCPTPLLDLQLHPQFPLPGGVTIPSLTTPTSTQPKEEVEDEAMFLMALKEKQQGTVELLIQECPPSLLNGFMKLFPGLESKGLTVITLCEKTKNSMSFWSAEIERERDSLLEHVICVCVCLPVLICVFVCVPACLCQPACLC